MDPLRDRLHELGEVVARASDETADARSTIARARLRLRAQQRVLPPSRSPFAVAGFSALLLCALGIGSYSLWQGRATAPLSFTIEARGQGSERAVQTGEAETKQVRFSDGTTVALQPASRIEVQTLSASGATVALVNGRARASVERSRDAEWRFLAGPFSVRVTGTEFDLAWDATSRVFELALHEGSVELSGPTLPPARVVRQGEYVRIVVAGEAPASPATPSEPQTTASAAGSATGTGGSPPATPSENWPELLRSGQRQAAFAAVDRLGAAALERASTRELWELAHAARLGGRPKLAFQALLSLRKQRGVRGQTAFLLGKVAADQLKEAPEAIAWFQTYLTEDPRGPLAEQALGRVIELQAGTRAGKRAAEEYLTRYPHGAYASFARSLLH
jgi:ferric-dicitrate binding protein FerR (iron transport regulator)